MVCVNGQWQRNLESIILHQAIIYNSTCVIECVLNHLKVFIQPYSTYIETAAEHGVSESVKLFLEDGRVNPNFEALSKSIKHHHHKITDMLLSDNRMYKHIPRENVIEKAITESTKSNNTKVFLDLIGDNEIFDLVMKKPTKLILFASLSGSTDILKWLLNNGKHKITKELLKCALRCAIEDDHMDVVEVLIDKGGVEPTIEMFEKSLWIGQRLLKLLIKQPKIQKNMTEQFLSRAHKVSSCECANLLLDTFPQFAPKEEWLRSAIKNGDKSLVERLVNDKRLQILDFGTILEAVDGGNYKIFNLLIDTYPQFWTCDRLLHSTINKQNYMMVKKCLDGGVGPMFRPEGFRIPIVVAVMSGHTGIVKLLLEKRSVQLGVHSWFYNSLVIAMMHGYFKIFNMILRTLVSIGGVRLNPSQLTQIYSGLVRIEDTHIRCIFHNSIHRFVSQVEE
jgi:ankyrin repeat protein